MATAKPKKPDYWAQATKHLAKADPALARLIKTYKGEMLMSRGSAFFSLARAIVGQQISVKAAESIWNRLAAMLVEVMPQSILDADTQSLRECGLSGQKVIYLKELSQFFATRSRHNWHRKTDAEVITDLISIKGIGKWSAEMFLIFHLLRPDIFPIADLGLRKGIERIYNKGEKMTVEEMIALSERWKPYRTVATWYLWRALDPVAVEY